MDGGDGGGEVVVFMATDSHSRGGHSLASEHSNSNATLDNKKVLKKPLQSTNSLRKRATLRRLSFSKPKSRNVEYNLQSKIDQFDANQTIWEEESQQEDRKGDSSSDFSSTSSSEDSDEEEEEKGGSHKYHKTKKRRKKLNWRRVGEWSIFVTILTCLILSLTIKSLRHRLTLGLVPWQWCLMVMVVFSGRLCSGWLVSFLVFVIERNFMLREKVLYFVYGLRKSIQNCVWLGLVLMAWTFMFNAQMHQNNRVVKKVYQLLVAILIGATIWLIKIVLVKTLASSFHVRTYFDRMKESVFHHYILDTLSGPPMDEIQWEEEHKKTIKGSKSLPTNWKKDAKSALR
ncbi:unnamed protein product, partial [Amaranthus hypochondriacus]